MLSGPSCCSARPRAMEQRSPKHHHYRARPGACKPHGPRPLGNCGRASTASSRCRHVRPGARSTGGPRIDQGGTPTSASPSPTPAHRLPGEPLPTSYPEATPTGRVQRRWGGSTTNHPAALRSGMQMGSDSPEQHEQMSSVRLSCLAPKLPETHPKVEVDHIILHILHILHIVSSAYEPRIPRVTQTNFHLRVCLGQFWSEA